MKYTPRQAKTNVNVSPTSPVKEFLALTGGLLAVVVAIYFLIGLAVNLLVPYLSVEFEKKLAGLLMPEFEQDARFEPQEDYLQSLADQLQNHCAKLPYDFKVHYNPAPQFNAVALPGGHIIFFSKLFEAAESENELVFVMAHEMGHYANRDHLKAMGRGLVLVAISTALFGVDSGLSSLLGNGLSLTELSFSRGQETQADEFALAMLNCSYGHINGAVQFIRKFPKEADPGDVGHYFSTHPEVERRMDHLAEIIRSEQLRSDELKPLPKGITDNRLSRESSANGSGMME